MLPEFLKKHLTAKKLLVTLGVLAINCFLIFSLVTRQAPMVLEDILALILFNGMYFGFYILRRFGVGKGD
ncbi:hypothetical protein ACLVWU_10035 [Bdellovibrio sp. HCB290]|uniref:hypothetical protein n=1 Tax=Bdellovibrio sp. HCB290 TaxID=3394356 RepID=UPI0039B46718